MKSSQSINWKRQLKLLANALDIAQVQEIEPSFAPAEEWGGFGINKQVFWNDITKKVAERKTEYEPIREAYMKSGHTTCRDDWFKYNSIQDAYLDRNIRPLEKEELKRRRYRMVDQRDEYNFFESAMQMYLSVIDSKTSTEISDLIKSTNVAELAFQSDIIYILEIVSEGYKTWGEVLSPTRWRYYVGMETMLGYRAAPNVKSFENSIRPWLLEKPANQPGHNLPDWNKYMEEAMHVFMAYETDDLIEYPTPMNFISARMWAKDGSSTGRTSTIKINSKLYKLRRNKNSVAFSTSNEELYKMLVEVIPQKMKAIPKREATKARPIITSDLPLYLKQTYISTYLEQRWKNHPATTLFMDERHRLELYRNLMNRAGNRILTKIPVDQSKFDHNITTENLRMLFRVMQDYIPEDMREIYGAMVSSVFHKDSRVQIGDKFFPIKNGLPSGWRWTALIDTIMNFAQISAAIRYVKRFVNVQPEIMCQGDDVALQGSPCGAIAGIVLMLRVAGYKVNPSKTWVSSSRDEFLRNIYSKGRIFGYPARTIKSIMWLNPVNPLVPDDCDRCMEVVRQWEKLHQRCDLNSRSDYHAVRDLIGMTGWKEDLVRKIMSIPVVSGGLGSFLLKDELPTSIQSKVEWHKYDSKGKKCNVELVNMRGIDDIINRATECQFSIPDRRVIEKFATTKLSTYDETKLWPVKRDGARSLKPSPKIISGTSERKKSDGTYRFSYGPIRNNNNRVWHTRPHLREKYRKPEIIGLPSWLVTASIAEVVSDITSIDDLEPLEEYFTPKDIQDFSLLWVKQGKRIAKEWANGHYQIPLDSAPGVSTEIVGLLYSEAYTQVFRKFANVAGALRSRALLDVSAYLLLNISATVRRYFGLDARVMP